MKDLLDKIHADYNRLLDLEIEGIGLKNGAKVANVAADLADKCAKLAQAVVEMYERAL